MKHKVLFNIIASLLVMAASSFAGWSPQTSGLSSILYRVDCISQMTAWTVGAGGVILHTTDGGANWNPQNSGVTQDLYGIDFLDSLNGWVTGFGHTILHTTDGGANWTPQNSGTSNDLLDIAFANLNRGWASGVSGTIVGTTNGGTSWNSEINGVWGWFWGVTAASATDAWVIGGDWFNHVAPIYHYNGTSWQHQYDVTATQNGQGISAATQSIVWAVGDLGTIVNTTNGGTNWNSQTSGVTTMINDVAAVSANCCYVAVNGGIILKTNNGGNAWERETTLISDDLWGVAMLDSVTGWAVGSNGVILHRTEDVQVSEIIRENIPLSRIYLYPKPVRTNQHLLLPNPLPNQLTIRLYGADGRLLDLLYSGTAKTEFTFNLAKFNPGIYFIHLTLPDNRIALRFLKID